jgi:hypothetical protein
MSFDLKRVLEGKRAYRRKLRALPVVEKLRLLDELRARTVTLSQASVPPAHEPGMVKEGPTPYRAEPTCPPKLQQRRKLVKAEAGRARRRAGKSA